MTGLLFISNIVIAQSPDDTQPLTINSDSFHFDNQTGIATYTGNVLATQGSRRLTGDRLEVHRDEKTQKMSEIIVHGNPARYEGLTDPDKPLLHAQAKLITYKITTQFLTLQNDAQVEQQGNIYRADKIEYDGIKDTVYSPPSTAQTTIILKDLHNGGI
jgi:lipopolysaccharide export system protein LptA